MKRLVTPVAIEQKIFLIRKQKVMLDRDLAKLYGVSTKRLNEQVKRNRKRFPEDFMFQLTWKEVNFLRSHFATLERGQYSKILKSHFAISSWGGTRKLPYAFTEQGVAMLSSVLHSERAVQVNIAIMRVFVRLRQILSTHKALACKLKELEKKIERHDGEIHAIFDVIRQLMAPPEKPRRKIGFHADLNGGNDNGKGAQREQV